VHAWREKALDGERKGGSTIDLKPSSSFEHTGGRLLSGLASKK
jgi:hypothetical protein